MKDIWNLSQEELKMILAECLVEPKFPDDPIKEAENITKRVFKRLEYKRAFSDVVDNEEDAKKLAMYAEQVDIKE